MRLAAQVDELRVAGSRVETIFPDSDSRDARELGQAQDGGVKLKLDLHEIYNRGGEIDRALRAVMDEAVAKRAPLVEIIPGKGSGAEEARAALPRSEGNQGPLPPGREGLGQLRPDLRPLQVEVRRRSTAVRPRVTGSRAEGVMN